MIKCHPLVNDSMYNTHMEREIHNLEIVGYRSEKILRMLFNIFTWQCMEGSIYEGISKSPLKDFLMRYDLTPYMSESPVYSAILLYNKLSRDVNIRELEKGLIMDVTPGSNKILTNVDFDYKELLDIYKNSKGDISTDFLLFNELFRKDTHKEVDRISNYGEITKISSLVDIIKPDLSYKLATKQLLVNKEEDIEALSKNKIYVLQDCTYSIKGYINHIKTIKAFILNQAFINDYEVHWLYIADSIKDRVLYTADNLNTARMDFDMAGSKIDTSKILTDDEFINQQVVLITDGTDDFDFQFNTKTKKISVISFQDNEEVKNKISNYGRFFKVSL